MKIKLPLKVMLKVLFHVVFGGIKLKVLWAFIGKIHLVS